MKRISLFILVLLFAVACTSENKNNVAKQLTGKWEISARYFNGEKNAPTAIDSVGGKTRLVFFDMTETTGKMSEKRNYTYSEGWVVNPNFTVYETREVELINNQKTIKFKGNNLSVNWVVKKITATNLTIKYEYYIIKPIQYRI